MNLYQAILFVGPPGSGKGTQCQKLGEDPSYFHFSTGEMLRKLDSSTNLGATVRSLIDAGKFVSDELITSLTQEILEKYVRETRFNPRQQYLLLDGIPRNVAQVSMITSFTDVKQIIYLTVPDEICIARLKARAARQGRADDSDEQKIRGRLTHYATATVPLLQCYNSTIISTIDNKVTAELVYQEIKKIILKNN